MNETDKYELLAKCYNCHWQGTEVFPKGVPTWVARPECPNCGCRSLSFGKDTNLPDEIGKELVDG